MAVVVRVENTFLRYVLALTWGQVSVTHDQRRFHKVLL